MTKPAEASNYDPKVGELVFWPHKAYFEVEQQHHPETVWQVIPSDGAGGGGALKWIKFVLGYIPSQIHQDRMVQRSQLEPVPPLVFVALAARTEEEWKQLHQEYLESPQPPNSSQGLPT